MKKKILWIILDLIFIAIFNIVYFLGFGEEHTTAGWIAYGFIHFSYFMLLISTFLIKKSKASHIFGFSVFGVSGTYFIIELIVGFVFILKKDYSTQSSLLTQAILCAIYLLILVSNLIANEHTAEAVEKHTQEVFFIKNEASRIKSLFGNIQDSSIKKRIEALYDLLHSSPSKSVTSLNIIECDIADYITELESAVASNQDEKIVEIIKKTTKKINERNSKIKVLS